MSEHPLDQNRKADWSARAFAAGGLALALAMLAFFSGPFDPPAPSVSEPGLAEGLVEGARGLLGLSDEATVAPPAPTEETLSIDALLQAAIIGLGGLSILMAAWGAFQGERFRRAGVAGMLGVTAVTFNMLLPVAIVILASVLVIAVIGAFDWS